MRCGVEKQHNELIISLRFNSIYRCYPTYLYKNSPIYSRIYCKMFQQTHSHSSSNSNSPPPNTSNHHTASASNHYLPPPTLTQLTFQQPISNSPIRQAQKKQPKVQWTCWTDDEHLKLAALFRDSGPAWEEIRSQFEKRQTGEIKRHFFASLKKLYQQLNQLGTSHLSTSASLTTLQFRDFKRLIEEIRKHKHKPEEIYTRSQGLIGRLMATQRFNASKNVAYAEQDLQELHQLVRKANMILSKKMSEASTAFEYKEQVQIQRNRIEKGYQSDSSSAFEQDEQSRDQLPNNNQYREDEAFDLNQDNGSREEQQDRGAVVMVEQDEQRIKELLLREGLLQFQVEEQGDLNLGEFGEGQFVEGDILDNQSYQHFYQQGELEGEACWRKTLCRQESLTETTTK